MKRQVQFHLGVLNLNLALQVENLLLLLMLVVMKRKPRLSMMFMQMSIASDIRLSLPKTQSAKEFINFMEALSNY